MSVLLAKVREERFTSAAVMQMSGVASAGIGECDKKKHVAQEMEVNIYCLTVIYKQDGPRTACIAVHVQKTNHCINWDGTTIQRRAEWLWQRRTVEAIQIRNSIPTMNLDSSLLLPMVWNSILNPLHTHPTISVCRWYQKNGLLCMFTSLMPHQLGCGQK